MASARKKIDFLIYLDTNKVPMPTVHDNGISAERWRFHSGPWSMNWPWRPLLPWECRGRRVWCLPNLVRGWPWGWRSAHQFAVFSEDACGEGRGCMNRNLLWVQITKQSDLWRLCEEGYGCPVEWYYDVVVRGKESSRLFKNSLDYQSHNTWSFSSRGGTSKATNSLLLGEKVWAKAWERIELMSLPLYEETNVMGATYE